MQDVNGQVYWSFATREDFRPDASPSLVWDRDRHGLTLKTTTSVPATSGNLNAARAAARGAPMAIDAHGTWARVTDDRRAVVTGRKGREEQELFAAPAGTTVLDVEWSEDGACGLLLDDGAETTFEWRDTLGRFEPLAFALGAFRPDRLAASFGGGRIWLLDRGTGAVRWFTGTPIPTALAALRPPSGVAAADPRMADPPRLETPTFGDLDGAEIMDAVAADNGDLVLLRVIDAASDAVLERVTQSGRRTLRTIEGAIRPFTIANAGRDRVAILGRGWAEARLFEMPDFGRAGEQILLPLGDRLVMRAPAEGRLCSGPVPRAHYRRAAGGFAPLIPVSRAEFAADGAVDLGAIDSGEPGFVWHRIYAEAILPPGTGFTVHAVAADREADFAGPMSQHVFGAMPAATGAPRAAWVGAESEKPFCRSALPCASERDRAGLFTCLMQKTGGAASRRIAGRFLKLRLEMHGPRDKAPWLHALRVWGPRFSYRDRYLPELYRIDEGDSAAGSDFLDRYLGLFESVLTTVEGEVANTWRLANARTAPAASLDWLAGWLGLAADSAFSEEGKRRLIERAAAVAPWHGTIRGLQGLLDVATDDGVARGRIVVVEHFRMRRTFATILGADLADRDDPLTRGTAVSGNSHLGPGFFLGAEDQRALFALFRPELLNHDLTDPAARQHAVEELTHLFDDQAHRVTVLIHDALDQDQRELVRQIVAREVPAHVQAEVHRAPGSLILGLTALLGVETHVGPPAEIPGFTIGSTALGAGRLRGVPSVDQRF